VAYSGSKNDAALDAKAQDVTCVYYMCTSIFSVEVVVLENGHQSSRCTCVEAHKLVVASMRYAGAAMASALSKIDDSRLPYKQAGCGTSNCVVW
jgi:hypothetical protein